MGSVVEAEEDNKEFVVVVPDNGGEAEEDNREFVVIIPGDGNGADKYVNRNDKAEDGSNDPKPAAPPPLGSGSRIGCNNNDDSNYGSNNDFNNSDSGSNLGGRGGGG